ncbi:MAG: DUF1761 domain-containing protein [Propioniciclava sp.]
MEISINWWGVVLAAVSAFMVGGLWYSLLFARPWARLAAVTEDRLQTGSLRVFAGSFLLAIVMATVLAALIGPAGAGFGALAGLAVGVGWVATSLGIIALFERRPLGYWAVNAGYAAVSHPVMGAIVGAFQG